MSEKYALFSDGKMVSSPSRNMSEAVNEAMKRGAVRRGQTWGYDLRNGYSIQPVKEDGE